MELLFYNPIVYREAYQDKEFQNFQSLHSSFPLIDRTGKFKFKHLNIKVEDVLIPNHDFNKQFAEIMYGRAAEAYRFGKPVRIFWSGGIDSTAVVMAFLELGNLFEVILTKESIKLNPSTYKNFVKKMVHSIVPKEKLRYYVESNFVNVTGSGSEEIFGDFGNLLNNGLLMYDELYEPKEYFFNNAHLEIIETLYSGDFDFLPQKTVQDVYWFLSLNLCWQYSKFFAFMIDGEDLLDNRESTYFPFFLSDDFQQWSLFNTEKIKTITNKDFKIILKKFTYRITLDEENLYMVKSFSEMPTSFLNYIAYDVNGKAIKRMI